MKDSRRGLKIRLDYNTAFKLKDGPDIAPGLSMAANKIINSEDRLQTLVSFGRTKTIVECWAESCIVLYENKNVIPFIAMSNNIKIDPKYLKNLEFGLKSVRNANIANTEES